MTKYHGVLNLALAAIPCPQTNDDGTLTTMPERYVYTAMPPERREVSDIIQLRCPTCERELWVELLPDVPGSHTSSASSLILGWRELREMSPAEIEEWEASQPQYFLYSYPFHTFVPPRVNQPEVRRRIANSRYRIRQAGRALLGKQDWS